jgi:hypothetical protein
MHSAAKRRLSICRATIPIRPIGWRTNKSSSHITQAGLQTRHEETVCLDYQFQDVERAIALVQESYAMAARQKGARAVRP